MKILIDFFRDLYDWEYLIISKIKASDFLITFISFILFHFIIIRQGIVASSLYSILFLVGIKLIQSVWNINKVNNKEFTKELFKLIDDVIEANNKDNLKRLVREKVAYLKYINQQTGEKLAFIPDSDAFELLHNSESILAITESHPVNWQNPTYNFYLINNLLTTLTKKVNKQLVEKGVGSFEYANLSSNECDEYFLKQKKSLLEKMKNTDDIINFLIENPCTFRFYWISKKNFTANRNLIEQLIAYHNLFGAYIIFIDPIKDFQIFDENESFNIENLLNSYGYKIKENEGIYDIAFGVVNSGLKMIFKKDNNLKSVILKYEDQIGLQSYFKNLADKVLSANDLLYFMKVPKSFTENEKGCHVYFKDGE